MKALFRVWVGEKVFEKKLELPCPVPYLLLRVGTKKVAFKIDEKITAFDEHSGCLSFEPTNAYDSLNEAFISESAALKAFLGDQNWRIQPDSD